MRALRQFTANRLDGGLDTAQVFVRIDDAGRRAVERVGVVRDQPPNGEA
jgi:hypothetical protein